MSDPILELREVHKSFKERAVLRGVDLTLPRGSVLGLIGKNGAGKTTLIKCALGLLRTQSGTLSILGEPAWTLSTAAKARIGYVPQTLELYRWMDVAQVIAYTRAFYPRWNERLVDRLLRDLELDPREQIATLSVGQAQKVGLVLALGHEPELLILDEPAASLDPGARRQFLALVLEVARGADRSVLFSTHLTTDLERVADQVVILKDGITHYAGALDDLKDEVKRLHVSSIGALPDRLDVPGLLHLERNGTQALLSVRGVTPQLIGRLEEQWSARVEARDLTLEDIFVELHRG